MTPKEKEIEKLRMEVDDLYYTLNKNLKEKQRMILVNLLEKKKELTISECEKEKLALLDKIDYLVGKKAKQKLSEVI